VFYRGRRKYNGRTGRFAMGVLVAVLCVILGTVVIHSNFGVALAALLAACALVYGKTAVARQAVFDHDWHALERLRTLSGLDFEKHVGELYKRLGYDVELTRAGGDQGIDVIATSPQQRIGIQCKQWRDVVGNGGVQEAIAGRAYYNCSHAAVICTSTFTQPARDLAERANVQLIDGHAYAAMVNRFRPMGKPTGLSAWMPRGRPGTIQIALLAAAIVVVALHYALQGFGAAIPTLSSIPTVVRAPIQQTQGSETSRTGDTPSDGSAQSTTTFANTAEQFYADLNGGNYPQAWALLSPGFKQSRPYTKWLAGYSDTVFTSPHITTTADPAVLDVVLTARERFGRETRITVYSGTLRGSRGADGSWLIDDGEMHMVMRR
jgi:hypothetical protein